MVSFWSLFLLAAYGILGGFIYVLNDWLGMAGLKTDPWTTIPLLGDFGIGTAIALGIQLLVAFLLYRFLNRPNVADLLIETENELRKVVWPSWNDTWAGTMAVMVTVVVLLVYLAGVDYIYINLFGVILGGG